MWPFGQTFKSSKSPTSIEVDVDEVFFSGAQTMSVRAGLQNFKIEISRWGLRKALARDLWVALERGVGLHLFRVQAGGRIRPPLTGDQRVEIPEDCSVRIVDHETIARIAEDPDYDISQASLTSALQTITSSGVYLFRIG